VDGNGVTRCFHLNHPDALVDGLTIRKGRVVAPVAGGSTCVGGGVYIASAGGTVQHCVILSNRVDASYWGRGGGVYLDGGQVANCILTGNSAGYCNSLGGGAYVAGAGTLRNCVVTKNSALMVSGVYCDNGGLVENCTVVSNSAGGACQDCPNWGCDNITYAVRAVGSGRFRNTAIAGHGIYDIHPSSSAEFYFCCGASVPVGPGNIAADPRLEGAGWGLYRLAAGSPCLNAGTNDGWIATSLDLEGQRRLVGGRVDIGAWESQAGMPSLAAALDSAGSWTSGGDTPMAAWATQVGGHDGVDSALSGRDWLGNDSWVHAFVQGPGAVGFWWQTSNPFGESTFRFTVDGSTRLLWNAAGATQPWRHSQYAIPQGVHLVTWRIQGMLGQSGARLDQVVLRPPCVRNDYDRDGVSDLAYYQTATGKWSIRPAAGGAWIANGTPFGSSTSRPVPGDYDGDGKSDLAVWSTTTGNWYIRSLATGSDIVFGVNWGSSSMVAVSGDYDGDGKADLAVYQGSTGKWYIRPAVTGSVPAIVSGAVWGNSQRIPVSGDYDGDGKSDLAVYDTGTGKWYIRVIGGAWLANGSAWGSVSSRPVSGDYDGDGKSDLAVYQASTGKWFIRPLGSMTPIVNGAVWGNSQRTPVSGDYNGDGKSDLAVYDTTTGKWYIRPVTGAWIANGVTWGGSGKIAVGSPQ
jgi:hypothetical protein